MTGNMNAGNMTEKSDDPEVKVYSTPTCPYCVLAKQYLASKGVKYSDNDVSSDRESAMEMVKKSGQMGVPVLDVRGKIIIGFDKAAIDSALGLGPGTGASSKNLFFDL